MTIEEIRSLADTQKADYCYWVTEWDAGFDLCHSCATRIVMGLYECGEIDAFVDGGSWADQSSDSPRHCDRCGMMLHYTLTQEGLDSEVSHYCENGVPIPLNSLEAFHLIAIEDSVSYDQNPWLK